jgi:hypothetical protein
MAPCCNLCILSIDIFDVAKAVCWATPSGLPKLKVIGLLLSQIQVTLRVWRSGEVRRVALDVSFFGADIMLDKADIDRIALYTPITTIHYLRAILPSWYYWESSCTSLWNTLVAIDIQNLQSPPKPKKKGKPANTSLNPNHSNALPTNGGAAPPIPAIPPAFPSSGSAIIDRLNMIQD